MVSKQRVHFDIGIDIPNEETLKSMGNIEKGENLSKRFASVIELMDDLHADIQKEESIKKILTEDDFKNKLIEMKGSE